MVFMNVETHCVCVHFCLCFCTQLVLPNATLRKVPLVLLDLRDCRESWGKKASKAAECYE